MATIKELKNSSLDRELHWLLEHIVKPELPQVIEALQICSNLILYNSPQHPDPENHIERGPSITLPVSSGKLEALKGIVVRDGAYIKKLSVVLKDRNFNRVINRIYLTKPILLPQIITAKKSIDAAITLMVQADSLFDGVPADGNNSSTHLQHHVELISVFNELLRELLTAKIAYSFPQSLNAYISQAEICLDLKDLHRVTEKPWCEIDETTGKSYVDKIRDNMSNGKNETPDMVDTEDSGVLGNVFSHLLLRHKYEPQDYITRCVTYNNSVVMVNKKIEVLSADPILVSAFTKLDSVEYLVSSFMENIKKML
ncbi:CIC11C00000005347 [Sungouiella intermedia]|uniref:CIC11C00000005347 n=1 Tax=Sungouiella intermedia TaxID=45354 RepID=A0A1L0BS48_9ASCO|nr:CIC11C00000005347 [[Candida] intermedia]